ncbi:helicase-primase complex component [Suid gammaherpesvirus 3]|uniref:Helicase-primase complex component n=1 Tax=Suid gammaherpesvirus 3 TaxID=1960249 RepID=Q8JYC0_9GAMA|nr:helicase-primase complex component [Porcine lymphotropic herpesvirus 1]AAM22140.1 helicase-primase complex component [Porcine lymphotropic herpesvirus 1]
MDIKLECNLANVSICFIWRHLLWLGSNCSPSVSENSNWINTLQVLLNLHCAKCNPEDILHTILDIMWTAKAHTNFWLLPQSFATPEQQAPPLPIDCLGPKNTYIFTKAGCCIWSADWALPANISHTTYVENLVEFYNTLQIEPNETYHQRVLDHLQQVFYLF